MNAKNTKRKAPRLVTAACVLGVLGVIPVAAQEKTVWDGVYSEAQARRGQELYRDICSSCHRDDLQGGGSEAEAPALEGSIFTTQWQDRRLVDLFLAIGTTMPQDAPDSLTPQFVIDIVSFLLEANGMPAGETELPPQLAPLEEILLTAAPGD
ncbi:MAG: c-type cytochrome [Vicinamibacterales bacterium]|jgi:mono/diheme cytochrome c family protein|nr:c-type cytochrome [Vicinamibacterales bacterium]MDP7478368.1 c-type cytochrome [Vicinamibacterales bacterium]MDP7692547.1 c-type cytochrome [Vicinamibacterales bacterium]HJN42599.1 c-type cytochrome [Vicinamibacterales bacterium]|tara:strand:- start:70 stop:528 length:459 start_codon:yes stop_codon:yes gene_type:complete